VGCFRMASDTWRRSRFGSARGNRRFGGSGEGPQRLRWIRGGSCPVGGRRPHSAPGSRFQEVTRGAKAAILAALQRCFASRWRGWWVIGRSNWPPVMEGGTLNDAGLSALRSHSDCHSRGAAPGWYEAGPSALLRGKGFVVRGSWLGGGVRWSTAVSGWERHVLWRTPSTWRRDRLGRGPSGLWRWCWRWRG
jgi:hypothetical protein